MAPRKLVVALDVDDVVVDLCGSLVGRYNATRMVGETLISTEAITAWEISECLPPKVAEWLYADMKTPQVYLHAPEIPGALEGVRALRALGHRVVFVTSCMNGATADAKLAWLRSHELLPWGDEALADYFPIRDKSVLVKWADVLVDDKVDNVLPWGVKGVLFERPHNRSAVLWQGGFHAPDWGEVVRCVGILADLEGAPAPAPNAAPEGGKPTNPKDGLGVNKLPLHLVPTTAIAEESLAHLDGGCKYGRGNYRVAGVLATVYVAAAMRHLAAYLEGEDKPSDSLATHLAHARASIGIVIDAKWAGKLIDDRNVAGGYAQCVAELTPRVAQIRELHAGKNPRHYTIADNPEVAA